MPKIRYNFENRGDRGGTCGVQNFSETSYYLPQKFFWGAEISVPIFEKFHLWDFFSKKMIFVYTSNQHKIATNDYFCPRFKIWAQLCNIFSGVQKFLSEISTGVRNFWRSLEKMKINKVFYTQFWRRNFCSMVEISAENENFDISSKHTFKISTGYN